MQLSLSAAERCSFLYLFLCIFSLAPSHQATEHAPFLHQRGLPVFPSDMLPCNFIVVKESEIGILLPSHSLYSIETWENPYLFEGDH